MIEHMPKKSEISQFFNIFCDKIAKFSTCAKNGQNFDFLLALSPSKQMREYGIP